MNRNGGCVGPCCDGRREAHALHVSALEKQRRSDTTHRSELAAENSWNNTQSPTQQLRRWADIVLVCPCSANTLAKIANGLCDNVVVSSLPILIFPSLISFNSQTSVLRALDPITPTYLFPAMNTFMYTHPLTAKQLKLVIDELGYNVIGPQGSKGLACGDIGKSLMLATGSFRAFR